MPVTSLNLSQSTTEHVSCQLPQLLFVGSTCLRETTVGDIRNMGDIWAMHLTWKTQVGEAKSTSVESFEVQIWD
jgi:hypothetical protein